MFIAWSIHSLANSSKRIISLKCCATAKPSNIEIVVFLFHKKYRSVIPSVFLLNHIFRSTFSKSLPYSQK
jgi:hypothetical protein